nr:hypothetical protein [Tanacetum cinerariifolium]
SSLVASSSLSLEASISSISASMLFEDRIKQEDFKEEEGYKLIQCSYASVDADDGWWVVVCVSVLQVVKVVVVLIAGGEGKIVNRFFEQAARISLVETYVKNAWANFGLERTWLTNGFFFFQFAMRESMKQPSTMCQKSRGGNSYARALVKVSLLAALKESLVVAIPFPNGTGHSLEMVEVEYEWKPPGVIRVKQKNGKGKHDRKAKQVAGIHLTKPKPKTRFWMRMTPPHVKTSYLNVAAKDSLEYLLDDDDEEVEEVYIEDNGRHAKQNKRERTPSDQRLCSKVFKQWQWTSNGLMCSNGSHIVLGWNSDIVNVVVVSFDAQVMHICVYSKG